MNPFRSVHALFLVRANTPRSLSQERRGIFMRRGKTMLWHDNAQPEPARAISWLIEFANDSDVLTAVAKNVGDAHRFGIIDTPSFERLVEEGREKRKEILCLQKD